MAAANASPRAQRTGILNSRLSELVDFNLAVDCLTPGCLGERAYPIAALAQLFGSSITVADVLRRMRCSAGCNSGARAAWLVTGAAINARVRPRRIALRGLEAKD